MLSAKALTSVASNGLSKATNTDPNNDIMRGISSMVKIGSKIGHDAVGTHKKLKNRSLKKKEQKLTKKQNKLQKKKNKLKQKKPDTRSVKQKIQEKAKQAVKAVGKGVLSFIKFAVGFFGAILIPLLIILFVLVIFLLVFAGGAENNTYILGTYNAEDRYLAEAINAYTEIAYDFNENVLQANSTSDWKKGLENLGIDTSDKKNTPNTITYGDFDGYTAGDYDYEADKLIAFMCAYTYEFSDDNEDIENWKWKDSYKDVLQELFDLEYTFVCKYNDASTWIENSGTGVELFPDSNTFAAITGSGYLSTGTSAGTVATINYSKSSTQFTNVSQYANKYDSDSDKDYNTLYVSLDSGKDGKGNSVSTGEILNYGSTSGIYSKGDYQKTGWTLQMLNWTYNSTGLRGIYFYYTGDPSTYYFYDCSAYPDLHTRGSYSYIMLNGSEFWYSFLISSGDWKTYSNGSYSGSSDGVRYFQMYKYNKECELYTCVVQNMTFEEAIIEYLSSMEDADDRLEFYYTLTGTTTSDTDTDTDTSTTATRGNHQMFTNPVSTDINVLIENGYIYNDYGYDIQEWNTTHCDVANWDESHEGIDIVANEGTNVFAMIDGEITEVNSTAHTITLESTSKISFWYNDDSERNVRITYENVTASVSEGDIVSAGDLIGVTDNYRHCDGCNNPTADCDYLHVSVEIYCFPSYRYVYPIFLIYDNDS